MAKCIDCDGLGVIWTECRECGHESEETCEMCGGTDETVDEDEDESEDEDS